MDQKPDSRITDEVFQRLHDDIMSGALPPGARLSVPALAARLGVSRSPVRDAVARLVQTRLAREEPRRGAVVANVGLYELASLYEVREVLEGLAARLAVETAGQRLIRALHATVTEHEQAVAAGDIPRHIECDVKFHGLIQDASGNEDLKRMLGDIQAQVRLAMRTTTLSGGPQRAVADHQMILAAIRDGDPAAAEQAARSHVSRLRRCLLQQADADSPGGAAAG